MADRLRLLTTHDFFGSFAPVPTSFGTLPGGEGLRSRARALRKGGPTLWIDTGDLTQGGPLTPLTSGEGGFAAAAELGMDVTVVGNHELDFGTDFLLRNAPALKCPLLGGNAGIDLPATALLSTAIGPIGVIGLTHDALASMSAWSLTPDRAMPIRPDPAVDVAALAADLRRDGARAVVLALHDGVDWQIAPGRGYRPEPARLFDKLRAWARSVDVIAAGHTLGRFFGAIDGTPVLQPWPLGAEFGCIDLTFGGSQPAFGAPHGIGIEPAGPWTGHGAERIDAAADDVLGRLAAPLVALSGGPAPLACFIASAIRRSAGAEVAIAYVTYAQPPVDGVFAALPEGAVTRLQLLEIVPYSDHRIVAAEIAAETASRMPLLREPPPQKRSTAWRHDGTVPSSGRVTIATTSGAAAAVIECQAGERLAWHDTGTRLDRAVRHLLSRTAQASR